MLRKFLKKETKGLLVELVFEFIVDAFLEKIASGFVLSLSQIQFLSQQQLVLLATG